MWTRQHKQRNTGRLIVPVISALFLAYIDRVSAQTKTIGKAAKATKSTKSPENPTGDDRLSSSPAE